MVLSLGVWAQWRVLYGKDGDHALTTEVPITHGAFRRTYGGHYSLHSHVNCWTLSGKAYRLGFIGVEPWRHIYEIRNKRRSKATVVPAREVRLTKWLWLCLICGRSFDDDFGYVAVGICAHGERHPASPAEPSISTFAKHLGPIFTVPCRTMCVATAALE